MITGELKNRIDGLWDIFAAGGLVNPLDVIEQITYLMFIHDLDTTDNLRAKESAMLIILSGTPPIWMPIGSSETFGAAQKRSGG